MNQAQFSGYVGDVKPLSTGKGLNISLCVNNSYFSKTDNRWVNKSIWITLFTTYLYKVAKGDKIVVSASIDMLPPPDGQKYGRMIFKVNSFENVTPKDPTEYEKQYAPDGRTADFSPASSEFIDGAVDNFNNVSDDVPF